MATMTAQQQFPRPTSSRARRQQQEKHREDVPLANYKVSASNGKTRYRQQQKQVDHASMTPPSAWGYPTMGYPSSPAEWAYYQQQYAAAAATAGSYYYVPYQYQYPNRHPNLWVDTSSTSSLPHSVAKSTSTPTPTRSGRRSPSRSPHSRSSISSQQSLASLYSQHHDPRPSRTSSSSSSTVSGASSTEFSAGRRSSITSAASSVSEMSVSSKRSLSRRLKAVFKGSSSSKGEEAAGATTQQPRPTRSNSTRRRSIAALSGLFHKNHNVPTVPEEADEEPLPTPPSSVVDASVSACPTPPRPSTPASSTASTVSSSSKKKRVQFFPTIQVHETFSAGEYDRRCDTEATCQNLTPGQAVKIKQELNEYKLTDMEVHVESRRYTHFLL